eukprot:7661302-Alexandrium_andersonii.AAC.1
MGDSVHTQAWKGTHGRLCALMRPYGRACACARVSLHACMRALACASVPRVRECSNAVSYTHLRAHETSAHL